MKEKRIKIREKKSRVKIIREVKKEEKKSGEIKKIEKLEDFFSGKDGKKSIGNRRVERAQISTGPTRKPVFDQSGSTNYSPGTGRESTTSQIYRDTGRASEREQRARVRTDANITRSLTPVENLDRRNLRDIRKSREVLGDNSRNDFDEREYDMRGQIYKEKEQRDKEQRQRG
jgi:hypothetical protein